MGKNRRRDEEQDPEPLLVGCLVRLGCGVSQSPELDHTYKIDVLVESIRNYPKGKQPIGIQMTKSLNKFGKMRDFGRAAVKCPGIGPLLYCEIDGRVTMPMGRALRECLKDLWNRWSPGTEPQRVVVTSRGRHGWKRFR